MHSEPVAAQSALPIAGPRTVAHDFAAALRAQQIDAAALETVTLGEMLGHPTASVDGAAAVAVASESAGPGAAVGALRWPVQGRATSEFGPRTHPVTGARRDHDGLDIAAPAGTPIVAAAAGTVTFAGRQGGYGNVVIVDHGHGTESRYAHQETIAVTAGQTVRAGQRIGSVGSTGLSTGPHLHFEVRRRGSAIDPRTLLAG